MKRGRKLISKIWRNSWLFLLATGAVFVLVAAVEHTSSVRCSSVSIDIDHETGNFFVEEEHIQSIIRSELQDSLPGMMLDSVNFRLIEGNIERNPYVAEANVYSGINGKVNIDVRQKRPLLRVVDYERINYYLDENGERMPVSENYTARVPVATVEISGKEENRARRDSIINAGLYELASFIDNKPFWRAQISQIVVTEDMEYELIPRLGPHRIVFGGPTDIDRKFDKLMTFYKEGLKRVGWGEYNQVSLKYEGQVVGRR